MKAHLDTHVALWIAAGQKNKLRPARALLARSELFVSSIVVVEMELLREIGRIREPVNAVLELLADDHGVHEDSCDTRELAAHARALGWTRDPFDRLIAAHALAARACLITADETIRAHLPQARWDR